MHPAPEKCNGHEISAGPLRNSVSGQCFRPSRTCPNPTPNIPHPPNLGDTRGPQAGCPPYAVHPTHPTPPARKQPQPAKPGDTRGPKAGCPPYAVHPTHPTPPAKKHPNPPNPGTPAGRRPGVPPTPRSDPTATVHQRTPPRPPSPDTAHSPARSRRSPPSRAVSRSAARCSGCRTPGT